MRSLFSPAALLALLCSGSLACTSGDFAGSSGKKSGAKEPVKQEDEDEASQEDDADDQKDDEADDDSADAEGLGDGSDSDADLGIEVKDDILAAVDAACADNIKGNIPVAPPSNNLPKTAAANCRGGIEFNNLERSVFKLKAKATRNEQTPLEIDIASYTVEDHMKLIAETEGGDRVVLDTCRLRTSNDVQPIFLGENRPPEDTVREFRVKLPKKTKALRFDFSDATSPTYMRVIGLCEFDLTADQVDGGNPTLRPASD